MTRSTSLRRAALGTALLGAGALAVCAVLPRRAAPVAPLRVTWVPDTLRQGAAVVVVVGAEAGTSSGDTIVAVRGTLAGEALRFERGTDGQFRALGAIPVGAGPSVLIPLAVARGGGDTAYQSARAPVRDGGFSTERIRLPRRFVTPPDSLHEQLEEERRTIRRALASTARTPRLWSGPFGAPLALRVTDAFGTRREINRTARSRHLGVDLSGKAGTPVQASARGVVVVADRFYYQGNAVYLDHGAGLVTSYMHLSRILVSAGDSVQPGQVIGLVGATGRVTGPHLHWTAYFGRVLFDPLTLLAPAIEGLVRVM